MMEITELSADGFATLFPDANVYDSVAFARLNQDKVDDVVFLSVGDTKPRFGIILGECDGVLRSPFSAPFGGFEQHGEQRLDYMDEAVGLLVGYCREHGKQLVVTPPPLVYGQGQLSKWVNIFSRYLRTRFIDLNYHFQLSHFAEYEKNMERNARKNLRHAMTENFNFEQLSSSNCDNVARVYEVIRRNREERGFPLRMTFEQVWQTVSRVVKADFFVLSHDGSDVAAAQVFHVSPDICQVVYWGDIRQYSNLRPMNMLTYSVFKHYYEAGLRILDIGPSTEGGIPNYGLCEFKTSIGCEVTLKYSFEL